MNVRKLALSMLLEYESMGKYINLSLSSHKTDALTGEERGFLTALLYTTVEHKITYDYYIAALSGRPADKVSDRARNILRLGLCQLIHMDRIPDFAAVNETVKLAGNSGERSFVNGILRRAVREKDSLPLPDREKKLSRYLSVKYSFPHHTVKRFMEILGDDGAEALLRHYSEIPPTDITVNTMKISVAEYIKKLNDDGIHAHPSAFSPMSVRIEGSVDPRRLPGYSDGEFFVQDASCAAAITALSPKSGECVVDVCAAPGGKSFASMLLMNGIGDAYAFDLHESKLSLISDGGERLGFSSIYVAARDARSPDESLIGKADKVICDVPCSGLGVLAKKPDLRYKSEESIDALPKLQLEILEASARYLKTGGRLLYSTCTLEPGENEGVLAEFLAAHPEYHTVPFDIGAEHAERGMVTLLPHIHGTDGFFISIIEKDH